MMDGRRHGLDPEVVAGLRQLSPPDGPDVLHEVLTVFLGDAPVRMRAIEEAIAAGDAAALQRAAHTLKGAAGSIGASALQGLCRDLESAAEAATLHRAGDLAAALRHELDRTRADIDRLLTG